MFRATIRVVHSDDSFRIGERKLNSTTESSLWTIFLLLQPHFTMRLRKNLQGVRELIFTENRYDRSIERMMKGVPNFYPRSSGIVVTGRFQYTAEMMVRLSETR